MIIKLNNLRVETIMGVYSHEKLAPRELIMNVEIKTDAYKKGSDSLKDTLDYDEIAKLLTTQAQSRQFNLIEKLADILLEKLLQIKGVKAAKLEIIKPACVANTQSVSIIVEG